MGNLKNNISLNRLCAINYDTRKFDCFVLILHNTLANERVGKHFIAYHKKTLPLRTKNFNEPSMRVLAQIPHPLLSITLFMWNQKYIIKYELDNLEQTYKIHELDATGEAQIMEIAQNENFIQSIITRFEAMRQEWGEITY